MIRRLLEWITWPWVCPHVDRRCIHGDEINATGGMRSRCRGCGRYFRALPPICSTTGRAH